MHIANSLFGKQEAGELHLFQINRFPPKKNNPKPTPKPNPQKNPQKIPTRKNPLPPFLPKILQANRRNRLRPFRPAAAPCASPRVTAWGAVACARAPSRLYPGRTQAAAGAPRPPPECARLRVGHPRLCSGQPRGGHAWGHGTLPRIYLPLFRDSLLPTPGGGQRHPAFWGEAAPGPRPGLPRPSGALPQPRLGVPFPPPPPKLWRPRGVLSLGGIASSLSKCQQRGRKLGGGSAFLHDSFAPGVKGRGRRGVLWQVEGGGMPPPPGSAGTHRPQNALRAGVGLGPILNGGVGGGARGHFGSVLPEGRGGESRAWGWEIQ